MHCHMAKQLHPLQVPAVMVLAQIGGPMFLGAIAVMWGTVAACFAAVNGDTVFYVLRLLLGFFEAGALPGMWTYLSYFYSKSRMTVPLG
jgi:MFS family permease